MQPDAGQTDNRRTDLENLVRDTLRSRSGPHVTMTYFAVVTAPSTAQS